MCGGFDLVRCSLFRGEHESYSTVFLDCRSKESEYMSNQENIILSSSIYCNDTNRKNNQSEVVYHTRTNKKEKRSMTQIQLKCKF